MNKKMKKWLPCILALFNVGSIVPLNQQKVFANFEMDRDKLEKVTKEYQTKWLSKFAEFQEFEDVTTHSKYYKWVLNKKDTNAYSAFKEAWPNEPNDKNSDEHIAWEAVRKVVMEPYFGIYSGMPYNPSALFSEQELVKCLNAIDTEVKKIIHKDVRPLSDSVYQVIRDTVPVVGGYLALSTIGYKTLGFGEKIFDSYADRYFESKFSGREQRAEDKRSKESVANLNWDFDSLPCDLIRQELFDTLVPMYPYAEAEIDDYITTLVGIIKQKQKNPTAPTVIINVYGDPGCGKSTLIKLTMQVLAKYNSMNQNAKALFITPSESQSNNDSTMVDRCFGSYSTVINGRRIKRDSTFASCLKYTQNFITILDDIDKLDTKDSGGGVFKILWNIADGGLIDGFPTSKVLFMATANSDLTLQTSNVSGSQSSQAMLSRIKNIHFPNPDSTAYQKSFISEIKKINDDESCKVSISDSVLKLIGDHCVKVRKGMREKNSLIIKLRGLLVKADSKGWKNAEIKFSNDELSISEIKDEKSNVTSSVTPPGYKPSVDKTKDVENVAIIASGSAKLDEKVINNDKFVDELVEKLKSKGVDIDNLITRLQEANVNIDELVQKIKMKELDVDKLDILDIDSFIESLKHPDNLNEKNNYIEIDNRDPILVKS